MAAVTPHFHDHHAMSPDSRFQVSHDGVLDETFDDEVVIVSLENGSYYSLNETGAQTWRLLREGATLAQIGTALHLAYGIDAGDAAQEVRRFVADLLGDNLLAPANGSHGASPSPPVTELPATTRAFVPPTLTRFDDLRELLLLDPVHDVDPSGWPMPLASGDAAVN